MGQHRRGRATELGGSKWLAAVYGQLLEIAAHRPAAVVVQSQLGAVEPTSALMVQVLADGIARRRPADAAPLTLFLRPNSDIRGFAPTELRCFRGFRAHQSQTAEHLSPVGSVSRNAPVNRPREPTDRRSRVVRQTAPGRPSKSLSPNRTRSSPRLPISSYLAFSASHGRGTARRDSSMTQLATGVASTTLMSLNRPALSSQGPPHVSRNNRSGPSWSYRCSLATSRG